MQVFDDALLDVFRAKRRCELCGVGIEYVKAEPHHIASKGMGGGGQLDIAMNLLATHLGCHHAIHLGRVDRRVVWFIVACREHLATWEEAYYHVMRVQAAPKEAIYDNGSRRLFIPGEPGLASARCGSSGDQALPLGIGAAGQSGEGPSSPVSGQPLRRKGNTRPRR